MNDSLILAFELYKARHSDLLRQAEECRLVRKVLQRRHRGGLAGVGSGAPKVATVEAIEVSS